MHLLIAIVVMNICNSLNLTHEECIENIPFVSQLLNNGIISMDNEMNRVYPKISPSQQRITRNGWMTNKPSNAVSFALNTPLPTDINWESKTDTKILYHGVINAERLKPILWHKQGLKESCTSGGAHTGHGNGVYLAKSFWMASLYYGTKFMVNDTNDAKHTKQHIYSMVLQCRVPLNKAIKREMMSTTRDVGGGLFYELDQNVADWEMEYLFHRQHVQIVAIIIKKFDCTQKQIASVLRYNHHPGNGAVRSDSDRNLLQGVPSIPLVRKTQFGSFIRYKIVAKLFNKSTESDVQTRFSPLSQII